MIRGYRSGLFRFVLATLLCLAAAHARAQPAKPTTTTTSGEFSVEPPTLVSLGFEGKITGDDNRNATVDVSYRRKGEASWGKGLPLLRLQREWVNGGPPQAGDNPLLPRFPFDYVVPNMFSGSVLNLDMGTSHYDYQNAWPARVKPGDVILVHAGTYVSDRFHYMNGAARPGYLSLGTVFDGDGAQNLFNLMADIFNMGDNCIESDGGARNIRVFRNRRFNIASQALSAQPMYGGPVYFYQNLVYDAPSSGSMKFVATPAGVLVYQNTFVGEVVARGPASNVHFRNNLVVSQEALDPVFAVGTYTSYSTSDYNAFRSWPGRDAPVVHRFKTLKEYSDATGQDRHSVLVEYDTFTNVTMPDKSDPQRWYKPDGLDFRLRPGSPAVDAGVVLPSINTTTRGAPPTSARTSRAGRCRTTGPDRC